jgi:hypothetical protein
LAWIWEVQQAAGGFDNATGRLEESGKLSRRMVPPIQMNQAATAVLKLVKATTVLKLVTTTAQAKLVTTTARDRRTPSPG